MAFHTLSYPSSSSYHKLCHVSRQKSFGKTRHIQVLSVPSSPFLLHTGKSESEGESEKERSISVSTSSDSLSSLITLENTVGVIGGVSVDSTLRFLRKLVQFGSKDELGNHDVPIVLCSDPLLSKKILSHERSFFPSLGGKTKTERARAQAQSNQKSIIESLKSKRLFLENSGARCVVMPCHVSHSWHGECFEGSNVASLHIGECVARHLKEANLKPIEAGSPLRIGVLATNATLSAGFYQEKLRNEGFEVVLPDKATMEHAVIPAIDAISRKDMEGAKNLLRIALQVLLVRAVNSVVLASDDMRNLLPHDDPLLKRCIDPIDVLAWSTIKWAQSAQKAA